MMAKRGTPLTMWKRDKVRTPSIIFKLKGAAAACANRGLKVGHFTFPNRLVPVNGFLLFGVIKAPCCFSSFHFISFLGGRKSWYLLRTQKHKRQNDRYNCVGVWLWLNLWMVVGGRSSFQADYGLFDWNVAFAAEESRLKVIRVESKAFQRFWLGLTRRQWAWCWWWFEVAKWSL